MCNPGHKRAADHQRTTKPMSDTLGPVGNTQRGFERIEFLDRYDHKCSLQMSSLAEYEQPGISAVWLGITDAQPKVMAVHARMLGVTTKETNGWVPYPLPDEVLLSTQMHLDREQVAALICHLDAWLTRGTFEVEATEPPPPPGDYRAPYKD